MGEVVDLPGHSKIPDENDHEFISDLARFADGLVVRSSREKEIPPCRKRLGALSAATMRWSRKLKPRNYAEYVMAAPSERRRSN